MSWKLRLRPVGRTCGTGKTRHYCREAAVTHMHALLLWERQHGVYKSGELNVYWCEVCSAFHVGHTLQAANPERREK